MTTPITFTDRTTCGIRRIEARTDHAVIATAYYAGGWVVDSGHPPNAINAVDYAHAMYLLDTLARLHGSGVAELRRGRAVVA